VVHLSASLSLLISNAKVMRARMAERMRRTPIMKLILDLLTGAKFTTNIARATQVRKMPRTQIVSRKALLNSGIPPSREVDVVRTSTSMGIPALRALISLRDCHAVRQITVVKMAKINSKRGIPADESLK
jgi:hypothetical protein